DQSHLPHRDLGAEGDAKSSEGQMAAPRQGGQPHLVLEQGRGFAGHPLSLALNSPSFPLTEAGGRTILTAEVRRRSRWKSAALHPTRCGPAEGPAAHARNEARAYRARGARRARKKKSPGFRSRAFPFFARRLLLRRRLRLIDEAEVVGAVRDGQLR